MINLWILEAGSVRRRTGFSYALFKIRNQIQGLVFRVGHGVQLGDGTVGGLHQLLLIIVQKAHAAIMDGENMENIRFRYTKEMDEYFREHTWDD